MHRNNWPRLRHPSQPAGRTRSSGQASHTSGRHNKALVTAARGAVIDTVASKFALARLTAVPGSGVPCACRGARRVSQHCAEA
jgi:hypothetical protein